MHLTATRVVQRQSQLLEGRTHDLQARHLARSIQQHVCAKKRLNDVQGPDEARNLRVKAEKEENE